MRRPRRTGSLVAAERIAAGGVDPSDPGAPLDGLPALSTHIYVAFSGP